MRKLILLALIASMVDPAQAARRLTVEQLQQFLTAQKAAKKNDADMAQQIGSLELTEQLTSVSLNRMTAELKPEAKTAQALALLADAASFLDPPAAEIPDKAPPDAQGRQALMNAAVNFVAVTLRQLPDFLATRVTHSFDDTAAAVTHSGWSPTAVLHLTGIFNQEITYRDGLEIVQVIPGKPVADEAAKVQSPQGLISKGEFGPVLATILRDSAAGKITWSHWEQMASGLVAVFHYQVPAAASHFAVNYCCVRSSEDPDAYHPRGTEIPNSYRGTPAYHGYIYVDSLTGALVRITIESELKASDPILRSAISVEYGSVEIGGKNYICPVRSVAISSALSHAGGDMSDRTILRINDVEFTHYHRFGTTMRVVTVTPPAQ
jgi:hypothetical protein